MISYLVRWPVILLLKPTMFLLSCLLARKCRKVAVIDLAGQSDVADFGDQIDRALKYIRQHDERRSAWLESRLDYVVSTSLLSSGGAYFSSSRSCFIRYARYYENAIGWGELDHDAQRVLTMTLASILIHEATHARIDDAGIRYDVRRRERIERICRRQQLLFMRRAAPEFRDAFGRPVDWSEVYKFDHVLKWYQEFWAKSRRQRFCELLERIGRKLTGQVEENQAASHSWQEQHRRYWDFTQEHRPWTTSMLYTRGCTHAASNNHELAITDLRQVVASNPEHTDALVGLGSQLYFAKRYEESLAAWLDADKKGYPNLAEWIVSVLWKLNRVDEALEWLARSPADPRDPNLLGTRAMLLISLQRYDEALRNLRLSLVDQTIEFKSNTYSYLAMQAELLRELGHMPEFLAARQQIETIQDAWHRRCDSQPIEIPAYVLETDERMFQPGISTCGATLLICPDEPNTTEHVRLLETLASRLLERLESDSTDYEDVYVRGLFTYHEQYPWREVPMSLTGGRQAWVVDVDLDRVLLPGGCLDGRIIRCWTATTKGAPHVWLCDDALDSSSLDESQQLSACC